MPNISRTRRVTRDPYTFRYGPYGRSYGAVPAPRYTARYGTRYAAVAYRATGLRPVLRTAAGVRRGLFTRLSVVRWDRWESHRRPDRV